MSNQATQSYDEPASYDSLDTYDVPSTSTGSDPLSPPYAIRLNYSDIALPTALTRAVGETDQVLPVSFTAGYPTPPFIVSIDAGTVNQEVCLVQSVSANSFTAVVRNFDGNGAFPHGVYAPIQHSNTALDYKVMNHHVFDASIDWHSQYLDAFRHLNPALHEVGTSIPYSNPGTSMPGDVASAGVSTAAAAADHQHGRETLTQILNNALPSGTAVLLNTQMTDTFFWLQSSSSAVSAPQPFAGWAVLSQFFPNADFAPLAPPASISGHIWQYSVIINPAVSTVKR